MIETSELASWTVSALSPTPSGEVRDLPAQVPGCVHDDLLRAGIIVDPYLDAHEADQLWIGETPWRYATTLAALPKGPPSEHERLELVCEGLDTVAEIELAGVVIGRTQNMHRTYRFDVTDSVHGGEQLAITFAPPVPEALRREAELGARPHVELLPFNSMRKMACSFGWDWNIRTATAGIWQPIRLERWRTARLQQVLLEPHVGTGGGWVRLRALVQRADRHADLVVRLTVAGGRMEATLRDGACEVEIELGGLDVERWWPAGHGGQPLHPALVELVAADDREQVLDRVERRLGFREVELDVSTDADGAAMTFVVNGRPILVKGVNWIPVDALVSREDQDRVEARLRDAVEAGCNLVRVWGGGVHASQRLAEACDRMGVLVWQDLLMACAMYGEEEPLRSEVVAEVREHVARLGQHASVCLFNGCNENLWAHRDWGWLEALDGRTWGSGYYEHLFPEIVQELAPHVPYTPGSPWSPPHAPLADDVGPNDPRWGSVHLWQQWNELPASSYRQVRPRFVAEFGWQSLPAWSTLAAWIHEDMAPDSPQMLVHQKAGRGVEKMARGLSEVTGVPTSFEQWHWASQYVQADALRTSITWFRSLYPQCTGTVWWQLNDAWPVASWAVVDWCGVRKPAWFAMRRAHLPRLLAIEPCGDGLELVAHNDTDTPWLGTVEADLADEWGSVVAVQCSALAVPARGVVRLPVDGPVTPRDPSHHLRARCEQAEDWWWTVPAKDRVLPTTEVIIRPLDDSRVEVEARSIVVDACLLVDKLRAGAEVDQGMFSLRPGERLQVRVRGLDADELARLDTVLVSANDFGVAPSPS